MAGKNGHFHTNFAGVVSVGMVLRAKLGLGFIKKELVFLHLNGLG